MVENVDLFQSIINNDSLRYGSNQRGVVVDLYEYSSTKIGEYYIFPADGYLENAVRENGTCAIHIFDVNVRILQIQLQ